MFEIHWPFLAFLINGHKEGSAVGWPLKNASDIISISGINWYAASERLRMPLFIYSSSARTFS